MLGFEETKDGHDWGIMLNDPLGISPDYVSFGMLDLTRPGVAAFREGIEPCILLDFNFVWLGDGRCYKK